MRPLAQAAAVGGASAAPRVVSLADLLVTAVTSDRAAVDDALNANPTMRGVVAANPQVRRGWLLPL